MIRYFSISMLSFGIIGVVYLLLSYSLFSRSIEALPDPPVKLFSVQHVATCPTTGMDVTIEEPCPEGSAYISHQCSIDSPINEVPFVKNLQSTLITNSNNIFNLPLQEIPTARCSYNHGALCDPEVILTMTLICVG